MGGEGFERGVAAHVQGALHLGVGGVGLGGEDEATGLDAAAEAAAFGVAGPLAIMKP